MDSTKFKMKWVRKERVIEKLSYVKEKCTMRETNA